MQDFSACLWGIRETICISCTPESTRCALSDVSLQTKSLIFTLQFFDFILLFLETKCQEFGKAMKKIAGCMIVEKKEQECGFSDPLSRPCILWKPAWVTDQQLLLFPLGGCNFSLCLFCVAVISKNIDIVKMQKNSDDNDKNNNNTCTL